MKYYAMIDGERRGPFELDRLAEAGVRPDTYVWCKGMADWQKAEDVADICRMFRIRIHDLMHPGSVDALARLSAEPPAAEEPQPASPSRFGRYLQQADQPDLPTLDEIEERRDTGVAPANMLVWAIVSTLFFPITGIAAIMMALKSRKQWTESQTPSEDGSTQKDEEGLRRQAHDYCQAAKMWTGVSFCLGLVFYGCLIRYI